MLTEKTRKSLISALGKDVTFAKEDLVCYAYDATNTPSLPDAVAYPKTTADVSAILKLANAENFFVIPRGAGTGQTGGSVPIEGGVVLSTERMKRIIEIDEENLIAIVEPGVVTYDFQQEVERLGLFYPPDPTSLKFSTIGGNIAENAGGPKAVKYGVTRDYVMGLEVVLPTGEIINTGVKTAKGVVGYDLTRLIVGSEGTLGIVTKATLKLIPLPASTKTILAIFPKLEDAARAVSGIIKAKIIPSTLEIVDDASMRCVEEFANTGLPKSGSFLLIEVDGHATTVEEEAVRIIAICKENSATLVDAASDKKAVKNLWKARRAISASLYRAKPNKINEDIVVPRSRIPELVKGIELIAQKRNLLIASFGHAGDGNIHVNIMYDKAIAAETEAAKKAVVDVFELTLCLEGTISGEHGIGITKAKYMPMELNETVIDVMKRIKRTLDPNGILNPGKIFLPDEKPVTVAGAVGR